MHKNYLLKIFELSRLAKTTIQILTDSFLILFCFFLSLVIRLNDFLVILKIDYWLILLIIVPITILIYIYFGFYKSIIRYVSEKFFLTAILAIFLSSICMYLISIVFDFFLPRSIPFIYFNFLLILTLSIRYFLKYLFLAYNFDQRKHVAIFGAGKTGRNLLASLNENLEYKPVIFLDDKETYHNKTVNGLKVYKFDESINILKKLQVNLILLAMPNISQTEKNQIIDKLVKNNFSIKKIPSTKELINNYKDITTFSNISIHDILEREEIPSIYNLTRKNIYQKVVLLTGAGGSIGNELCKQILDIRPKILIYLDNSEYSLYKIDEKIKSIIFKKKLNIEVCPILGSVQDKIFLKGLFNKFKIQTIYHAAAYKHVPLVEKNIIEGIKNNIFGTNLISELSILNKVRAFILISSDKAVRPTNYMGATKRVAELICQTYSEAQTDTVFSIVRFGNVIGSSGSVVPLFEQQIKDGGPVTLTHKEITRYFMTISEAVGLVIQAGAMSNNGDLFILEMGKPLKILNLAEKIIRLYGMQPIFEKKNIDIDQTSNNILIKITGLRPGEKIYEELLISDKTFPTQHPRIFKAREKSIDKKELKILLSEIESSVKTQNVIKVKNILEKAPIGFDTSNNTSHTLNEINKDKI